MLWSCQSSVVSLFLMESFFKALFIILNKYHCFWAEFFQLQHHHFSGKKNEIACLMSHYHYIVQDSKPVSNFRWLICKLNRPTWRLFIDEKNWNWPNLKMGRFRPTVTACSRCWFYWFIFNSNIIRSFFLQIDKWHLRVSIPTSTVADSICWIWMT